MTEPLTPPNCDLSDFAFMPLVIQRLRRSRAWLKCKRNPALAFYMVNLWTACWHEVPAGSLENDDDVLADFAMCDPAKWAKVKGDVLHGWVLCDDGRLYHPTVSEKARESWDAKLDQRWRTECARIKKHADRHHMTLARPTFEEWIADGCPQGGRLPVPRDTSGTEPGHDGESSSKGQGERQGQGDSSEANASAGAGAPPVDNPTPAPAAPTAEDAARQLWRDAGAWFVDNGLTAGGAKAFMSTLAKDHPLTAADALREAIKTPAPADAKAWAAAIAKRMDGERRTVPSDAADRTQNYLAAQAGRGHVPPPAAVKALVRRPATDQQQEGDACPAS